MLTSPAQRAEFVRWFLPSFLIALAIFLIPLMGKAMAQAAPGSTGVDFTPLAEQVIAVAVAVLTVVAGFVARGAVGWLASKTKLQDNQFEALLSSRVHDILQKSIDYAESWAKAQVADPNSPIKNVEINNFFVEQAVRYAQRSMPDLIAHFGLTHDRITDMIKSRLNPVTNTPAVDSGKIPHAISSISTLPEAE